ncbi:MAG: hypothetical protein HOH33_02920 [Verrucomicrobia bacterium]|jgi:hypothetical protein|nr:hypothetical protein [Verrucomicrobiota bacterium]
MKKFWLPTFVFAVISAVFCYTVFLTARSEEAGGPLMWPILAVFLVYLGAFTYWGCRTETEHH